MRFIHTDIPEVIELQSKTTNKGRWYTAPNGNIYASVTTVLGAKEKPGLTEWRNMLGTKKADKETKRCADRGEAVHKMAEDYLNNIEEPTKKHKPDNVKLFNQLRFKLNKINNIRAQEVPLHSDSLRLAGRVDCVGEYEGVLSIIDFKTSNNNKDEILVEDYFLQCTAYAIMYNELYGTAIDDIVVLIAVEKGMTPMVYKRKIYDFVKPLLSRINTYYEELEK
jgi:genome maintenance exonuclease 1